MGRGWLLLGVAAVAAYGQLAPHPVGHGLADDRVLHFTLYAVAVLGASWWPAPKASPSRVAAPVRLALLLGLALETAQAWVPGRTFDVADMAANLAGAAVGWLAVAVCLPDAVRQTRTAGLSAADAPAPASG